MKTNVQKFMMLLACAVVFAGLANIAGAQAVYKTVITWSGDAQNVTAIEIWRTVDGGAAEMVASLPDTAVSYEDQGVLLNTQYCYTPRFYNSGLFVDGAQACVTGLLPTPAGSTSTIITLGP